MTKPEQRLTYAPFAPPDVARVEEAIAAQERPLICPRCSSQLETGEPIATGGGTVFWLVRCSSCRRSLRVNELPEPG